MEAPEQTEDKLEYERGNFITVCRAILDQCEAAEAEMDMKNLWFDLFEMSGAIQRLMYQLRKVGAP